MVDLPDLPTLSAVAQSSALVITGGVVTKLVAYFMAWGRDRSEIHLNNNTVDTNNLATLREGNRQLIDGLAQQIRLLQRDLSDLRDTLEKCEDKHTQAQNEIIQMREDIAKHFAKPV